MYPFGSDDAAVRTKRVNWFEQMDGFLSWKLIPPNITDPFSPPIPDHVLSELANNPQALRRLCSVKCQCDGYEIMSIKNLASPTVRTDHPCITTMPQREILEYMNRSGITQRIAEEIDNVRTQIEGELKRRTEKGEFYDDGIKIGKPLDAGKDKKDPPKRFEYRVIRL